MAGFDITAANAALKRVFDKKGSVAQMQDEAPYSKSRRKVSQKFGAGLYSSIQTQRNQSIGIRNSGSNDNQDLPSISNPAFDDPNFEAVRTYGRIYASGKAVSRALSGDDLQSFLGNIGMLAMDWTLAYWRDCDFRAFNTSTATGNKKGCRGILNSGAYSASGTAQTFTLDVATGATHRRYRLCQGIQPGMLLDVYSKTTWTKAGQILVSTSSMDTNPTFTGVLDTDLAATSDEWYLFREGDFDQDIAGLGDILDDGTYTTTYAGITTSGRWAGHVLSNSGTLRDFSPTLMNQAKLLARKEAGDKPVEAWMSYGMLDALEAYVQHTISLNKDMGNAPFRANVGGDVEAWGANTTIKVCAMAPAHSIFLFQPDRIDYLEQESLGPVKLGNEGGKDSFWTRVTGKDNWEAAFVHEFQQRTLRRNVGVKIEDLNQSTF